MPGTTFIRLRVTIEPHVYSSHVCSLRGSAELVELHIRLERWKGEELNYREVVARDHFRSLFDRVWERAKWELDAALSASD